MTSDSILKSYSILVVCAFLSGCATIMTGSSQQVSFNSNPEGATVTVNGLVIGKTPISTAMKRKSGQTLVFSLDGHKPVTMRLETRLNSWFWGNILLGGLFGSTTDGASGAVAEYSPSQYMVTLQPENTVAMENKTSLTDRQKLKEFVVMGYRPIMDDLRKGDGQYLSSLMKLLNVQADQRPEAIKRIRGLSEAYPDIPEFADRLADAFQPAPPAKGTDKNRPMPTGKSPTSKSSAAVDGVM